MVDAPQPNELHRDVDASMRMFERSKVGESAALSPIKPSRVMAVLDGSSQDQTTMASVAYLRETFNVETVVLDARDKLAGDETDLAIDAAGKVSGARPIVRGDGESYDAILAALDTHAVDLVLIPCPFGRSFEKIGTASAGTVIDVMLSRCPKPMLIVRRDDQPIGDCVQAVRVVVSGESDVEIKAAGWAFGMAAPDAVVSLNLVVEEEQYQNIRAIIKALTPETSVDLEAFSAAVTKTHATLHGAMAKTASAMNMTYELKPQAGEVAPPNPLNDRATMLLVMPIEVDDRFAQGFVQDRIRRSPHPVLVVPGHVPHP
jgi:hypothetical protein